MPSNAVVINVVAIDGAQSFSSNPSGIPSGQLVVWHNVDSIVHRVVLNGGGLESGNIPAGGFSSAMAGCGAGRHRGHGTHLRHLVGLLPRATIYRGRCSACGRRPGRRVSRIDVCAVLYLVRRLYVFLMWSLMATAGVVAVTLVAALSGIDVAKCLVILMLAPAVTVIGSEVRVLSA